MKAVGAARRSRQILRSEEVDHHAFLLRMINVEKDENLDDQYFKEQGDEIEVMMIMPVVENMTILRNNTWSRTTRGSSRNPTTCSSSSAAPSSDLSTVFVAKDAIMYFSQNA